MAPSCNGIRPRWPIHADSTARPCFGAQSSRAFAVQRLLRIQPCSMIVNSNNRRFNVPTSDHCLERRLTVRIFWGVTSFQSGRLPAIDAAAHTHVLIAQMKLSHITWRIRPVGWTLLVGGCIALAWFFVNISSSQRIGASGILAFARTFLEGDMIPRAEAMSSLREFQLKANCLFRRMILLPTAAMFLGGIILAIGKKKD